MSPSNHVGPQIQRSTKIRLIVSAVLLLLLALGFNALLSLNALEKLYVESIASQYSAIGKDLQRNIESALRFGKSIEKFVGIEKLLEETTNNLTKDYVEGSLLTNNTQSGTLPEISVSIAGTDGKLLYSTNDALVGTQLSDAVHLNYHEIQASDSQNIPSYVQYDHLYYTPLPIWDRNGEWIATAIIAFDEQQVKSLLDRVRNASIRLIIEILIGSVVVLVLLLNVVVTFDFEQQRLSKLRIALIMLLVIGAAQVLFSVLNTHAFGNYYLQINQKKAETLTSLLKEDIEFLLGKGIQINKLVKMDELMGEVIDASPEVQGIKIVDRNNMPLYMATDQGVTDFQNITEEEFPTAYRQLPFTLPRYTVRLELLKDGEIQGFISTHLSREKIWGRRIEIALDSATIFVVSMLFFSELLILAFSLLEKGLGPSDHITDVVNFRAIRPVAFLFFFGIDIFISFLPLYMATLTKASFFGLSQDMIMGLPISVQMLFTGIAFFLAGVWNDRRGWHEPFLFGLFVAGTGFFFAWWAAQALYFVVAMGVIGFGYGLSLMASQGFVIGHTDEQNQAQGLAQLYAGIYAGSICGAATGAMLAERLGYSQVFFIGGIILFFTLAYTVLSMRHLLKKPGGKVISGSSAVRMMKRGRIFRFLWHRNVWSLILFNTIPAAIALVGLLNYLSPIYLQRIGTSQSNIGRVLMIYGLCMIYIAPLIAKHTGSSPKKKRYVVVSGGLGSVAFLAFYLFGNITSGLMAVALAVLCMGLSDSFAASRNAYSLNLKVSRELGEGTALSIFYSMARIGQVVGPMLFGWLLMTVGINRGIAYVGMAYLGLTLLFLLTAKPEPRSRTSSSGTSA